MKTRTSIVLFAIAVSIISLSGCIQPTGSMAEFTVDPSSSGYTPLKLTFDASHSASSNGPIVSYEWQLGDDSSDTGVRVEKTYEEKGEYEVILVVTDSTGATDMAVEWVTVNNHIPVARMLIQLPVVSVNYPIRLDASASFDLDGEIVDYLWSFGDGTTDEGKIVSHAFSETGSQVEITLTVVDDDGDTETVTDYVQVRACCGG